MKTVSNNAIMPIAGMILTFIACYELIQLVIAHNNLANFETWIFFKWIFKTYVAVMLITHCFDITMAFFDVAGYVISQSGNIIQNSTAVNASQLAQMRFTLEAMSIGELLPLFMEIGLLNIGIKIMSMMIFLVIYGRMIEIYLMISLAPLPFSTFGNREQSQIGQNYVKSLVALGFQGFFILICVAIYAVLIQNVSISSDIAGSLWSVLATTYCWYLPCSRPAPCPREFFSTVRKDNYGDKSKCAKRFIQGKREGGVQSHKEAADMIHACRDDWSAHLFSSKECFG